MSDLKEYEMQANSESDTGCIAVSGKGYYMPLSEYLKQQDKITDLEQQLKQQWVSVDITDIRIDSVVKLRSGDTGVVFGIYDVITDSVNGGVAAARFFIRFDNNKGEQYHTHRKDGVSYAKARGDIIEIKPPTK